MLWKRWWPKGKSMSPSSGYRRPIRSWTRGHASPSTIPVRVSGPKSAHISLIRSFRDVKPDAASGSDSPSAGAWSLCTVDASMSTSQERHGTTFTIDLPLATLQTAIPTWTHGQCVTTKRPGRRGSQASAPIGLPSSFVTASFLASSTFVRITLPWPLGTCGPRCCPRTPLGAVDAATADKYGV